MTCIYTILSPSDKIYVGQTTNFKQRSGFYKSLLCKAQPKLYNSLQKHGWESHECSSILELREDILPEMLTYWEQFFINYYRDLGYNLLNLREAGNKGKLSAESRMKLSKSHIGKKLSDETRKKMSDSRRGEKHPLFGKKRSEETKQKLREANLGKVGFWLGKKGPGKKHSAGAKNKISEAHMGDKNPRFKGFILAYKDNELLGRFAGCYDVARQLGIPRTSILRSINEQRQLTRKWAGYKFIREK
jgi:group I intron endonuclease